jgi:hypothetical protein
MALGVMPMLFLREHERALSSARLLRLYRDEERQLLEIGRYGFVTEAFDIRTTSEPEVEALVGPVRSFTLCQFGIPLSDRPRPRL